MAVYLFALGAALLFGLGSVVQQRVAFESPPGKTLRLALLWYLVRQPLWLAGVATAAVGNGFSAAALGIGSVALVQPLLVTRLLFALPLSAAWMRQRLSGRDWLGALATAGGLGAFLAVGRPQPGQDIAPPLWRWGVTIGAIAAVTLVLVLVARRLAPEREAPMLGAGAGMLFGLQSGLMHTAIRYFIDDGLTGMLLSWTPYAVAVTAVTGTLLAQSAYSMAPLTASYPALAAVEPLAGIGIGVGVLGGGLAFGAVPLAVEAVALAVMTLGIYLLATSPLVTGEQAVMRERQEEGLAFRTEEELQHDLSRLDADLRKLEETAGAPRRHRSLDRVCEDLDRVNGELDRLTALQADIHQHREEAHQQTERLSEPQQQEVTRHERELRDWEAELDDRERQLRTRADELTKRAEVLRAGE